MRFHKVANSLQNCLVPMFNIRMKLFSKLRDNIFLVASNLFPGDITYTMTCI